MTDQAQHDKKAGDNNTQDGEAPTGSTPVADEVLPETAEPEAAEKAAAPDSTEPEKPEPTKREPSEPKPPKSGSGKGSAGWFASLLFLILLAALAVLAYYGWQREQALQAQLSQLDQALSEQTNQLISIRRQTEAAVTDAESSIEQSRQQISGLQNQLQSRLDEQSSQLEGQLQSLHQQLRSISTTTTEDWKLAEAYYLTRLANQRLLMERDTGNALALLAAADEIVRNYPDPDLYPARRALADDMATLRMANNVDLEGLYLRLAALGHQAQNLPRSEALTFSTGQPQAQTQENTEADGEAVEPQGIWSTIRQSFHRALSSLEGYIRVSRDDDALEPLMTGPAVADQLLFSLQLNLDAAQLALLREQPKIYRQSLERAMNIIARLAGDNEQRQRFLSELQVLHDADILQELPRISDSQQALSAYLERRHRLAPLSNGEAEARSDQP